MKSAKYLIGLGADVNNPDKDGQCPLHHAVFDLMEVGDKSGRRLIDMLIKAGADVDVRDGMGMTPLEQYEEACQRWNVEMEDSIVKKLSDGRSTRRARRA